MPWEQEVVGSNPAVPTKFKFDVRGASDMTVAFIDLATGRRVEKQFGSYYLGMKFVNKIRRSKKVQFLSYWRS